MLWILGLIILILLGGAVGIAVIFAYGFVALILAIFLNPIFWIVILLIILVGFLVETVPSCLGCLGIIVLLIVVITYILNK